MIINAALLTAGVLFFGFSARWNWWRRKVKGLPVLMYHKIGHAPKNSKFKKLWVTPEKFVRQLDYLKKHNYTSISFSDLKNPKSLPKKPVLITFDDGYTDNYKIAYPLLKKRNIKANIFLVYEAIGQYNHWHNPDEEHWLPMMTFEQIKQLQKEGLVQFGAHTLNHPNLTGIDLETARCEIEECKHRLEQKLGVEITAFAYPYGAGAYDPKIRKLVFDAGFLFDFGIKQGITPLPYKKEEPFKRLLIRGDDNILDFHLNLTRGRARY
jgi:peptidoglycan/xylan/chitin deacetylase (PgdA/CDA1 family)